MNYFINHLEAISMIAFVILVLGYVVKDIRQ